MDKYCGIYKTLGDKRLATHLLQGLEIILKAIIKLGFETNTLNENDLLEIKNSFDIRRLDHAHNKIIPTNMLTKFRDPSSKLI